MRKKRILITGSRGLIGKILTQNLCGDFDVFGVDVRVKDNENGKINFKADISNYQELATVCKKISPIDCVLHLAADSEVEAGWKSVLKNNILATKNVYECARIYNIKKVIFASSNHATGGYEGIPPTLHKKKNLRKITVTDPIRPDSDYGTSKIFGEVLARQYLELYNINSICIRIGTVLKDDDPLQDERHRKTWLSHSDLIQLIEKSISSNLDFGIYYGVSNNKGRFWDISNAEKEIHYQPKDDASKKII